MVLAFFTNDVQDNLALDYATLAPNPRQPRFEVDRDGNLKQVSPRAPAPRRAGHDARSLLERSLFISFTIDARNASALLTAELRPSITGFSRLWNSTISSAVLVTSTGH